MMASFSSRFRVSHLTPVFRYNKPMMHHISSKTENMSDFLQSIFSKQTLIPGDAEKVCKKFCTYYNNLPTEVRPSLLRYMAQHYGINCDAVTASAQSFSNAQDDGQILLSKAMDRLRVALLPRYQTFFKQIGRVDGGVKFLVDVRADLLRCLHASTDELETLDFQMLNLVLFDILNMWFSVGFLQLQRVTWTSPADIMQKISDCEAVHPIRNWADLKQRVGLYRRCYIFTHHSMPREPVVVLHAALMPDIADSIHSIIRNPRYRPKCVAMETQQDAITDHDASSVGENVEDVAHIGAAVFYSITSTQNGLKGVELGNYLIKSAVRALHDELPNLNRFSSLSPVPGFRSWLLGQINMCLNRTAKGVSNHLLTRAEMQALRGLCSFKLDLPLETFKHLVKSHQWLTCIEQSIFTKAVLLRLCARYLYQEKRRGYALNPVANFHLSNGAVLWRINHLSDTSIRGLDQSCGLMVNYRYYLSDTDHHSHDYLSHQRIAASQSVLDLLQSVEVHVGV